MCLATIWPSLFVPPSASSLRPRRISVALEDRSARKNPLRTNLIFVLSVMTTVVSAPRESRMVNLSPLRLLTMPVAFAFFPPAITVVSGALDPLGSTVNAALSWPSTRPEHASVIANATNRICEFLLFIYSFPLFSAHSVKLTVSHSVRWNCLNNCFSHLLQVALRLFLGFLFGIHGARRSRCGPQPV